MDVITTKEEPDACYFQSTRLYEEFRITGGIRSWYLGCAFGRDRVGGVLRVSKTGLIEPVTSRHGVHACSNLPISLSA